MVRTAKTKSRSIAKPAAAQPLFINLDANGKPTDGDHVAVYQFETGLIWTAAPLQSGKGFTHKDAMSAATKVDLLGKKCRAPTVKELLSLIDYERFNPTVDPKHFRGPYGFAWSSTPYQGYAGYFRGVDLRFGYSGCFHQDGRYRALAVRAGQFSDSGTVA